MSWWKANKGKVIAGIIGATIVALGVTATVLTGGLAAIGFLAVGAVASVGIMYAGANQDYKRQIGPVAYKDKHGYTALGLLKKWMGKNKETVKENLHHR